MWLRSAFGEFGQGVLAATLCAFILQRSAWRLVRCVKSRHAMGAHRTHIWVCLTVQGPRRVKLFINRPTIGFSEATDEAAAQELELSVDDLKGDVPLPLRCVPGGPPPLMGSGWCDVMWPVPCRASDLRRIMLWWCGIHLGCSTATHHPRRDFCALISAAAAHHPPPFSHAWCSLVKFQRINWLTIFVVDNQEGEESTVVEKIALQGSSGESFNVAEIKDISKESQ